MDRIVSSRAMSPAVFSQATAADDEEIRALLRAVPMHGALQIGFSREPSYFACHAPAGIAEQSLLGRRDGRLISVGAWSVRDVWMRGEVSRVGYLQGLRMAQGTAGSMRVLREGYAALSGQVAKLPVAGWFTSVDAANARARRIFESRASGLPRYRRIAGYRTRVVGIRRRGEVGNVESAETREELTEFLQREGARHELALTWNDRRWEALVRCGFSLSDVAVVRRRGRIVAAAGVWDQRDWKQIVVHRYPDWLRRISALTGVVASCMGRPRLPMEGAVVPMAPVFPFAVAEGSLHVIPELWRGVERIARRCGVEWLALGLDEVDPLWESGVLPRIGIDYRTVLYQVSGMGFLKGEGFPANGIFRPECATL